MKLAHTVPVACACCYQQHIDRRHVDFEVFYDGPVMPGTDPRPIDDLVICENCVTTAAKLIGLTREDEMKARIVELEGERAAAVDIAAQHQAFADAMRAAVALDPRPVEVEREAVVVPEPPAPKPAKRSAAKKDGV